MLLVRQVVNDGSQLANEGSELVNLGSQVVGYCPKLV